MRFAIKVTNGKISVDSNGFLGHIATRKDGWYVTAGLKKPTDNLNGEFREYFFAVVVRAWQDKLNESSAIQALGRILYCDNHICYQILKQMFGRKDPETGEPESISDNGSYTNDEFKRFVDACEDGYFDTFGEGLPKDD